MVDTNARQRVLGTAEAVYTGDAAAEIIEEARQRGLTVDGHLVSAPVKPGQVAFSIQFDDAGLNWQLTWSQIDHMVELADRYLRPEAPAARRGLARQLVLTAIRENRHLDLKVANIVALMAIWLMFRGDSGDKLRLLRVRHAGYIITEKGPEDYNFRLVAGRT